MEEEAKCLGLDSFGTKGRKDVDEAIPSIKMSEAKEEYADKKG